MRNRGGMRGVTKQFLYGSSVRAKARKASRNWLVRSLLTAKCARNSQKLRNTTDSAARDATFSCAASPVTCPRSTTCGNLDARDSRLCCEHRSL